MRRPCSLCVCVGKMPKLVGHRRPRRSPHPRHMPVVLSEQCRLGASRLRGRLAPRCAHDEIALRHFTSCCMLLRAPSPATSPQGGPPSRLRAPEHSGRRQEPSSGRPHLPDDALGYSIQAELPQEAVTSVALDPVSIIRSVPSTAVTPSTNGTVLVTTTILVDPSSRSPGGFALAEQSASRLIQHPGRRRSSAGLQPSAPWPSRREAWPELVLADAMPLPQRSRARVTATVPHQGSRSEAVSTARCAMAAQDLHMRR